MLFSSTKLNKKNVGRKPQTPNRDEALMSGSNNLHVSALTHPLFPSLHRPTALSCSSFRSVNKFISTGHFEISFDPYENRVKPICAQARRSFSSTTEEIASAADLQYEGPLKIVKYPVPILRAKNKKVGTFGDALKKIADEMFGVMYRTDGIGLSAPQVGINIQLMVFNSVGEPGKGEEIVLVNPRIIRYSKKLVLFNEGCLSFPGIYADVERPDSLKVDAQDITGARFEVNLTGLPARVFQHEYDHLLGILFFDRMSDEVLDSIRADLQVLEKSYEERTGLPSPEKIDARRRRKKAVGFGNS